MEKQRLLQLEIVECNDYHNQRLQQCFREYFEEIGEYLKENTKVFDRMQRAADSGMHCYVIRKEEDILGFIQFQQEVLTHEMGFFTEKLGFIRELWVSPTIRKQGCGAWLVSAMEAYFKKAGVAKLILTYEEDALGFYQKLGFVEDKSYQAENEQDVVIKILS